MKRLTASAVLMGLALFLSCGGGGEEAEKNGTLYADVWDSGSPDSLDGEAMLYADVMVDISDLTLKINGTELEKDVWDDPYPNFFFGGSVPKANPSSLSFTSSTLGNASASVNIPGPTNITSPQDSDTLPTGQDVVITWEAVSCDFYWVDVFVGFYDSNGGYLDWKIWSGYTTNATYTLPKDSLSYPGAAYAAVNFELYTVNGPVPTPGNKGNITGDLAGFFYGVNQGDSVEFYVGNPVKGHIPRLHRGPERGEFLKSMKELME